jgi:hypothetical protein
MNVPTERPLDRTRRRDRSGAVVRPFGAGDSQR